MLAFITGSRAYGSPRPDSDIDLVIRCNSTVRAALHAMRDNATDDSPVLRFGRLNIVACLTDDDYAVWKFGTAALEQKTPVKRNRAISFFKKLRSRISNGQDRQDY